MKILVCPDSFKGTLTSIEAADLIEQGIRRALPSAEVIKIPIADGGEGSLAAFGAHVEYTDACGPYFERIYAPVGISENTAIIEMASTAGLPLVGENKNPAATTTFGVGEQIEYALERGADEIILCLGGSATNDAGCGMAAALGARFTDTSGKIFIPVGGSLSKIDKIDLSSLDKRLSSVKITVMCDVKNPLFGSNGAAYVYAPQKGADEKALELLDNGLRHFARKCIECVGIDVSCLEGGGAAGGMGAGAVALLGGELKSGIETVLAVSRFDEKLIGAELVITGEGSFDTQSLSGKVVSGIASHMLLSNAKLIVLAGRVADNMGDIGRVDAAFSIQREPMPLDEALKHTKENLIYAAENVMRLLR